MDVSCVLGILPDDQKKNFFDLFQEAIYWAHTDDNDETIMQITTKLLNNTMRINDGRIVHSH